MADFSGLPDHVGKGLNDFLAAAQNAFGGRLSSAVLFGSAVENRLRATSDVNLLLILTEFRQQDVDALSPALRVASAAIRLEVMYLLCDEVTDAVECFAQKFGDIVHRHRTLIGEDPFAGRMPSRVAEIHRLRQVILNLQLRMREAYVERAGQSDRLFYLLADYSGPLRTCAASLLRLENQGEFTPREALERFAGASPIVAELPHIRDGRPPESTDPAAAFFAFLELAAAIRQRAWNLS